MGKLTAAGQNSSKAGTPRCGVRTARRAVPTRQMKNFFVLQKFNHVVKPGLPKLELTDIFVSMKAISKRELLRNPSLASHLKPGQSLQLEDGKKPLVLSRRKRVRLTAAQIHAQLDRLCEGAPAQDAQAALRDLRR